MKVDLAQELTADPGYDDVEPTAPWGDFDAAVTPAAHGREGWEASYQRYLLTLDATVAALAGFCGFLLRFAEPSQEITVRYLGFTACLPLVWCALLSGNRAYERRFLYVGSEETRRVVRSGLTLVAGVSFLAYAFQWEFSRGYLLVASPLLVVATACGRYALRKGLHRSRESGDCMERTIIVGHLAPAEVMRKRLLREQHHGLDVVAVCLPPGVKADLRRIGEVVPLARTLDVVDAVEKFDARVVVVLACPEMDGEELRRLSWRLEHSGAQLLVAPALVDVTGPRTSIRLAAGLPLLHMEPPVFAGFRRVAKSVLDRSAAALGLVLVSPVLVAIMALIMLEDGHSPFFRQRRVGRHGQEFTLLKFRTMHVDAEAQKRSLTARNENDGVLFKIRNDPRVTRVGRHLRRYSLDELLQLVNVLRGEMSLVGPRPPLPAEVSKYHPDLRRRLVVPPGLTGLWQVSGRSDLSWDESMYLDLHYVENWTPALDLMILLKTVRAVVKARGAY
jgi:exopolysaccharide biosynthesis polyprenyl glycosylphosphotransferase